MSDTAYNPVYLSAMPTGRSSIDDTKNGTEMSRLADKIINYKGDQAGLNELRTQFGAKFGKTKSKPIVTDDIKHTDWRLEKDENHLVYSNLPKIVTTDPRLYSVFVSMMCGANLVTAARANHISDVIVRETMNYKKIWSYTEFETGRKVSAENCKDLVEKAKEAGLDAPRLPRIMSNIVYTNGGIYERRTRGRHAPKNKKTGFIGCIEKKIYMQEVVYKGEDNGQGDQA